MSATFDDGQRVRCVDDGHSFGWLTEGDEYTIRTSVIDEDGELVQLVEHPEGQTDEGYPLHEWMPERFEAIR